MIENVKYFGKLTAIALWTWIKINLLGFISLVITFTVSLFILFSDENLGPAAHTGFFGPLLHIIVTKPFQSVLFFLIIISTTCFIRVALAVGNPAILQII